MTDAGRYAPVGTHARDLVEGLLARHDVRSEPAPAIGPGETAAVRLVPGHPGAAELVVVWTDFPGVRVRAGRYLEESFPSCGCDACDEDPVDLAEDLETLVASTVDGDLVEEVTGGWRGGLVRVAWAGRSQGQQTGRSTPRGRTAWAAWPARTG
ncbi:hypothetical protein ASG41_11580 [Modestobacter sp. Leaf380]|nr:hypothetical protein ASG41_11580 [Modestobacter sp. Leaf380]